MNDKHLLEHIKNQTVSAIAEMDGISTDLCDKFRSYYSVACSDTFRFQLKRLLTDSVSETVALGYKNMFVRDFLNVDGGNFFQNVLINTMCVFDKSYDQQLVSKILDADKPIFIDGYCNFRLDALKRKWEEIAKLVCDNDYILHDEELIMEFLQYLLDSVNHQTTNMTLSLEGDTFIMYDAKGKVLQPVRSLAKDVTAEEEAAVNVLLLKPKRISVYYGKRPEPCFLKLLELFDCKLVEAN
ncbi:MAG: hypothetical protein NC183_01900 [Corallococcus sp.]|nr:hypothetical protein [Corallococcus sp.]MCM1359270.1 hypothetical protein [Corallococcus sp.]